MQSRHPTQYSEDSSLAARNITNTLSAFNALTVAGCQLAPPPPTGAGSGRDQRHRRSRGKRRPRHLLLRVASRLQEG